ncbi:hypothetical protein KCV07_g2413, partial [Aureobasidium melanogenum]
MPTWVRKKKPYDVVIVLYDTISRDKYGLNTYTNELERMRTAISLSPSSKWRDVRVESWNLITYWFGTIEHSNRRDYSLEMSMHYTVGDAKKTRTINRSDDHAFFGLLARDDILDLELRINVTHRYKSFTKHLEEVKTREESSQKLVEEFKVDKSESTVSVKEIKTHSCIIQ